MCANAQTATWLWDINEATAKGILRRSCKMNDAMPVPARILVVNDVEETRDGLSRLLASDGYCVDSARGAEDAIERTKRDRPGLILLSTHGPQEAWVASAERIREGSHLNFTPPIVLFGVEEIPEGAEVEIQPNLHLICPDNFDQLRRLLRRLLPTAPALR
jgi:CheY-like chemotaxis protein